MGETSLIFKVKFYDFPDFHLKIRQDIILTKTMSFTIFIIFFFLYNINKQLYVSDF